MTLRTQSPNKMATNRNRRSRLSQSATFDAALPSPSPPRSLSKPPLRGEPPPFVRIDLSSSLIVLSATYSAPPGPPPAVCAPEDASVADDGIAGIADEVEVGNRAEVGFGT